MKNKGSSLIETIVAITIFLIAIIPIMLLTLNSLRSLKKSSEIEERSKVTTTVINYIKSRGYNNLISPLLDSDSFSNTYTLIYDEDESAFVIDNSDSNSDFENDFFGTSFYDPSSTSPDALFVIDSLGIDLDGATVNVSLKTSDLFIQELNTSSGEYEDSTYVNHLSTSSSSILIGSGGIIEDQLIFGSVLLNYTSKDSSGNITNEESYEQNFVINPIENFK